MTETVQSLWIGPHLSRLERVCLSSFMKNGHRFQLYVYHEPKGVPNGVELLDANHVVPEKDIFMYPHRKSYAAFANLFRYVLLERYGGYWVDTDIVCLRPLPHESCYVFTRQHVDGAPASDQLL